MRERGMIFNADMVRAVLNGSKTQTRRILTPHQLKMIEAAAHAGECYPLESGHQHANSQSYYREWCPFGLPGDRLWVRETFATLEPGSYEPVKPCDGYAQVVRYAASDRLANSDRDVRGFNWRPSIHLPRWASRITLEITGVRVERLNSINEHDAIAEGLAEISKDGRAYKYGIPDRDGYPGTDDFGWPWHEWERYPISAYSKLWRSIYGEESWQANPWVWVIEFKRVEGE
ncbi:hypothetical protein C3408_11915 [Candidatus Pantoea alvi]|uniref:hypothetical protein n=1 Tax=Enterobacter agglomerans TaxID=549 RepID=UPI000CDD5179|nr:hypothetical protein [Pantoea agglomerans]POW57008.1 hypothetical protein C3408_11915 [Pantoea alvi]UBN52756.1 hypothetical protein LB453_12725 [Pantoea agglomerans]